MFCAQRCWKTMMEKSEMKILGIKSKSDERQSINIYLDEDLKSFTYITVKKESKILISSISCVLSSTGEAELESFSVELKSGLALIFVPLSVIQGRCWLQGLQFLLNNQQTSSLGTERRNLWLKERFQALSTSDHHCLKYNDTFEFLNSKHTVMTREFFDQKLKEFLKTKNLKYKTEESFLHVGDFLDFYKYIFDRKEIQNLFNRLATNGAFMSLTDLEYFLTIDQKEGDVTQARCKEITLTYEVTQVGRENLELNIDGFTHFLLSIYGQLFNSDHDSVYQDMDQPLTHYFIASSHNTYLCGTQLSGESSAQAYSDVIEKGCRCVEVDCWDGDDDEPIVYHGYTLTTKVLFKDVIQAIDESAFKISPYPLIVSLENHCSLEAQKKMASYMRNIFGEKMYVLPVDKSLHHFPSPEYFKYKILIRGKCDKLDEEEESVQNGAVQSDVEQGEEGEKNEQQESKKKRNFKAEVTSPDDNDGNIDIPSDTVSGSELTTPSPSPTGRKSSINESKKKVAKELSNLINYVTNSKFTSFEDSLRDVKFWLSSSFVEGDMLYHNEKNATSFVSLNTRQLTRVYPGGRRIDSSNYNPINAWNIGCQIVALNHQTNDQGMALYYGKFRQNGKTGYVLKPHFLRDPSSEFNPNSVAEPSAECKVLRMTIISGQQLPDEPDSWALTKDEPDPYVQVEVLGVPVDEFTFTTSTYYDNSFNPTWNEKFETTVHVPELAMVKFSVFDKDIGFDDFIGQAVMPFVSLRQGYRHVPLENKKGVAIPCASIFVHVHCEDYVEKPVDDNSSQENYYFVEKALWSVLNS